MAADKTKHYLQSATRTVVRRGIDGLFFGMAFAFAAAITLGLLG